MLPQQAGPGININRETCGLILANSLTSGIEAKKGFESPIIFCPGKAHRATGQKIPAQRASRSRQTRIPSAAPSIMAPQPKKYDSWLEHSAQPKTNDINMRFLKLLTISLKHNTPRAAGRSFIRRTRIIPAILLSTTTLWFA